MLWLFGPFIAYFEAALGPARGEPGSQLSAMVFTDYFPHPAVYGTGEPARALISPFRALAVEAVGTGVLVLMIFRSSTATTPPSPQSTWPRSS